MREAEGQYLFKLITRGCRGCVCAYIFVFSVLFIVHMCECDFGKEDMWTSVIMYTGLHEGMLSDGFVPMLHRLLTQTVWMHVQIHTLTVWFCMSECVALSAVMTSSMLHGLQLLLSVINIPAVEILACIGKHDKTVTHRSPCSQHRLSFV